MRKILMMSLALGLALGAQEASEGKTDSVALKAVKEQSASIKLTLDEAKKIALRDNPTLASAKARIDAAAKAVERAMSAYYPSLDLQASVTRLQDGTNGKSRETGMHHWDRAWEYQAGLTAKWLLFDASQRKFSVLQAKYGESNAVAADADARRLLLRSVGQAFYAALLSQDSMNIAKEDAQFNNVLLDDAKKRRDGGIAKPSEVLNFVLQVQNADVDYIAAEKNWRVAMVALGALLSITEDGVWNNYELVPPTGYDADHKPFGELFDYACQHRPDLKAADDTIQIKRDAIESAQFAWLPTLSAFGNYSYARQDSLRFSNNYDRTFNFGLTANWNIFNGFNTQACIAQARADLITAIKDKENIVTGINSDLRRNILAIESNRKQLERQEIVLDTAKKIRDLVKEEYMGGTTTITRVNETQSDVIKAQSSRSAAYIQLLNSIEDLKASTGENLNIIAE